jgi:hypothetical protein
MRIKHLLTALALAALMAAPALAATFHSDLGYSLKLPDDWSVLTREQIKKHPEVVDAAFSAAQQQQDLAQMPKTLLSRVKKLVNAGEIDYFFSPEPRFTVSVHRGPGRIPAGAGGVVQMCRLLEQKLSEEAGRDTQVHDCRSTQLDGRPGIYLIADNYWQNQKYIQVQAQLEPNKILVFTASSRDENFDQMSREFDRVMGSVRMPR